MPASPKTPGLPAKSDDSSDRVGFRSSVSMFAGLVAGVVASDASAQPLVSFESVGFYPMSIGAPDLDGDGRRDLVVACRDGLDNAVFILDNLGDGTFGPARAEFAGTSPRAIAVGDFDGNGFDDFVVALQNQALAVFLNDGSGTLIRREYPIEPPPGFQGHQPRSVEVGDLDDDGDQDLLLTVSTQDYYTAWGGVTTFRNDGSGTFEQGPVEVIEGRTTLKGLDAGDLDGDGDLDLVAGHFREVPCGEPYCYEYTADLQTLAVFRNDGDGTSWTSKLLPVLEVNEDSAISDVALVDLDGDGDLDVAARLGQFGESAGDGVADPLLIQVYRNDGSGGLDAPEIVWGAGGTLRGVGEGLAARDLEGDGDVDLVTVRQELVNRRPVLVALLNAGDGSTFDVRESFLPEATGGSIDVFMGDLSDDGVNDVVVGFRDDRIAIVINPLEQAGPAIAVPDPLVRGTTADVVVTGAPADRPAFLVTSRLLPAASAGIAPLDGLTLDVSAADATIVATARTDGSGAATLGLPIASDAAPGNLVVQAVVRSGPGGAASVKTPHLTRRISD